MLKIFDISLTDKISLHFGEESSWYLIPTICFQKLDLRSICSLNYVEYLFAIKWLKVSCGIVIKTSLNKSN